MFNKEDSKVDKLIQEKSTDALFISGGATRFVGLSSSAIRLYELGYNPKVVGGISAGSIIALPLVMGLHKELLDYGSKASIENIFEVPPVNKKGDISWVAITRVLFGNYSFGIQNIKPLIKEVITKDIFNEYKNGNYADIYIMAVDMDNGSRKLWNIKNESYENYLKIVSASSRIPIMTQFEEVDNHRYFDGGIRSHIPTMKVLKERNDVKKIISIYSRPENHFIFNEKWDKNIIKVIMRTLEIMSIEISKRDEEIEKMYCQINNIDLKQIFLPNVLDSLYDTNPENLKKLMISGIEAVDNNINNFIS